MYMWWEGESLRIEKINKKCYMLYFMLILLVHKGCCEAVVTMCVVNIVIRRVLISIRVILQCVCVFVHLSFLSLSVSSVYIILMACFSYRDSYGDNIVFNTQYTNKLII